MNRTGPVRRPLPGRVARGLTPAVLTALLVAGAAACGDSDTSSPGTARSTRTLSAEPEASPSASPGGRTQDEFAASVSADAERDRQKAAATLKGVKGKGDAIDDVSVSGIAVRSGEKFRSALVRVTNRGDDAAFFAVRVEFVGSSDKVLDSVVLGFSGVAPGETVSEHANSAKAAGVKSFPRVAQAERS
ncbi:hypothetical protein [Streptomyces sp. NBC_00525]|uniref:hypothetical protein n=1 Tax=Streptomyces sp. NBC_00525 TaxID=2903660 RepID=UPI002E80E1A2|nr:hypothetical protein [Streptomyces sp. NBC_00525]WUC92338.1 hypothetical protein OG710_01385 [Streptomyces sp. NBC_00525]